MSDSNPSPDAAAGSDAVGEGAERLLRELEWTVLRRLAGTVEGDYRTLFRGQGLDLADLREYQPHDDVRHIDWNVTARMDAPFVREFHQDRELTAWFLLDLSASLDFGSGGQAKREVLLRFVALMARLLAGRGNRVGAVLFGREVETVWPARAGRQQVLQLLHRLLQRVQQPAPKVPRGRAKKKAPEPGTDLGLLLRHAGGLLRRRSQVFVVSDFISEPGWSEALGRLAMRHELLAVRVVDPLERSLPELGLMTMQDAETGEQLLVDTADRGFRRRFEAAVEQHEARLRIAFADAGVDVLELDTAEDALTLLRRYVALRRLRQRQVHAAPAGAQGMAA